MEAQFWAALSMMFMWLPACSMSSTYIDDSHSISGPIVLMFFVPILFTLSVLMLHSMGPYSVPCLVIAMFKVKHDLCPELTKCLFNKNPYPKAGQQTFHIPRVKSVYMGKLSLSYFGPVVWEKMLPDKYKNIETLYKFEEEIKKWVPDCKYQVMRGMGRRCR